MAFYALNFGEKAAKNGRPMQTRGQDNRSYSFGAPAPVVRDESGKALTIQEQLARKAQAEATRPNSINPSVAATPRFEGGAAARLLPQSSTQQQQQQQQASAGGAPISSYADPTALPLISGRQADLGLATPTSLPKKKALLEDPPVVLTLPSAKTETALFERLDFNGNGMLSLAELDKACVEIWPKFNNKPAIMRAYKAADANNSGFISRKEFTLFLRFLVRFNELWNVFTQIDSNGDRRLNCEEFITGAKLLRLDKSPVELRAIFNEMDTNRGGVVLFDEFCHYIARAEIDEQRKRMGLDQKTGPAKKKAAKVEFLQLPLVKSQRQLFDQIDVNRNGTLSLAELDKAVVELWPSFNRKPAIMRAYKAADASGNGWLNRREFSVFLQFLVVFENLWRQFEIIDTDGDRRLTMQEFVSKAPKLPEYVSKTPNELEAIFRSLDKNGGGVLLFDEFCQASAQQAIADFLKNRGDHGAGVELPPPPADAVQPLSIVCHYCGKTPGDIATHLKKCQEEFEHCVASLPYFLQRKAPKMELPLPTRSSEVKLYNETATVLHNVISMFQCPECKKMFPARQIGAHFKAHDITYTRRMEIAKLAKLNTPQQASVILPRAPEKIHLDEEYVALKQQVVRPFDLSKLSFFRKRLYVAKIKGNGLASVAEFMGMCKECSVVVNPRVALAMLQADPGDVGNVMAGLERAGCSEARTAAIRGAFALIDVDNQDSVEYRKMRDAGPVVEDILVMFCRPLEKLVSLREFENILTDLSVLYPTDQEFSQLITFRAPPAKLERCTVRVTFVSGAQKVFELTAAPGSMKTDRGSLTRRLSLLGVKDVQKIDVLPQ